MPVQKLRTFLDENGIKYVTIQHSKAYTAPEVAASAHIPGQKLAKVVVIRVDGEMSLAVLPAHYRVDIHYLRDVIGASTVEIAVEREFADRFPGCEVGAMPPFGNLYGMETYVEESLAKDDLIAFNAGSHTELIQLRYADFERLVQPRVLEFYEL